MEFSIFINNLETELRKPLPGKKAQDRMASKQRYDYEWNKHQAVQMEKAAVMILFFPKGDTIQTAFIKRLDDGRIHGGQVSFPGGRYDLSDRNLEQAAVRETFEETGVNPLHIKVIGKISPLHIIASNNYVETYVGYTDYSPGFIPRPEEMQYIICVNINHLLDKQNTEKRIISIKEFEFDALCYIVNNECIWGATAMIMSEMVEIIKRFYMPNRETL